MKIPQLFIKVGNNKFTPISYPVKGKAVYFWDEAAKSIVPAKDRLQMEVIHGHYYFILKSPTS